MTGEYEIGGKKGPFEETIARDQHRVTMTLAGSPIGAGIDNTGAWQVAISGVFDRVNADEAIGLRFDAWLARRQYLSSIDPSRDAVRCELKERVPRVVMRAKLPNLGNPELVFDLSSAQLLSASSEDASGHRASVEFSAWSPADEGVRWPIEWEEQPEVGSRTHVKVKQNASHVQCGEDCAKTMSGSFSISWPKEGRATIPMRYMNHELSIQAQVGGRNVWALLDSGAGLSVIDSTTALATSFQPAVQLEGAAATQKVSLGLGELRDVGLGKLLLPRLPVVSVPIPALDGFGIRRPDFIAGFSIFASSVVRVDYKKSELVFAKAGTQLHTANASSLPIHMWSGKPMAEISLDGVTGYIELDTGNGGSLAIAERWAELHGFPGERKTAAFRYRGGAGTSESTSILMRVKRVSFGPIVVENSRGQIDDSPAGPNEVGLVGNEIFSRCTAVIFDVPSRKIWFEPPCNRPVPEQLSGWRLEHKPDPAVANRPWLVGKIVPGGSAERAGLQSTDRLLSVGGKAAVLDRTSFEEQTAQAPGSKVKVEIMRDGKKLTVELALGTVPSD
jgi:hypothetical protein